MNEAFTVIVSSPDADGLVAGALVGRAVQGRAEALVFDPQRLTEFFEQPAQARLPRGYDLVLCGGEVVHRDWDGRLVRPQLMDALRRFTGPMRWYASGEWAPEDVSAVGHTLGVGRLVLAGPHGSAAQTVRDRLFGSEDAYEDSLARFAAGRLSEAEERAWGAELRRVLAALKGDAYDLSGAVGALMEGHRESLIQQHWAQVQRVEGDNRQVAQERAEPPRRMGDMTLVCVSVPAERSAFWAEIGAYAREDAEAELSLCSLEGRSVMILAREPGTRADLRAWARYVTDLLPMTRVVQARADFVPLVVGGLKEDAQRKEDVLNVMADGAHLLDA